MISQEMLRRGIKCAKKLELEYVELENFLDVIFNTNTSIQIFNYHIRAPNNMNENNTARLEYFKKKLDLPVNFYTRRLSNSAKQDNFINGFISTAGKPPTDRLVDYFENLNVTNAQAFIIGSRIGENI